MSNAVVYPRVSLIVLGTVLILAGCGTSDSSDRTPEESGSALYEEMSTQMDGYQWAPNYSPDIDKVFDRVYGGTMIQNPESYSAMILGIFEQCSWTLEWLDAWNTDDEAAQERALKTMADVFQGSTDDPEAQTHLMQIVDLASLGDPAPAQQFVEANCLPVNWTVSS